MTARTPEDVDRLWARALSVANLDELVALYEPQAAVMPISRQIVIGAEAIREALAGLLAVKPKIVSMTPRLIAQTGDLAIITAKWDMSMIGPDGNPAQMTGESVEIMRRQADGRWLLAVDLPWGVNA